MTSSAKFRTRVLTPSGKHLTSSVDTHTPESRRILSKSGSCHHGIWCSHRFDFQFFPSADGHQLNSTGDFPYEHLPGDVESQTPTVLQFPVSDRCYRGECDDTSGPMVPNVLNGIFTDSWTPHQSVVPDEIEAIQSVVLDW